LTEPFLFSSALLRWHAQHGRTNLPWQNTRDPYRVWLSEVMLQQTQVVTAQAYYARFLEAFPSVAALAAASQDRVPAQRSCKRCPALARRLLRQ
jgi:A/G-specific adenine glycosylase